MISDGFADRLRLGGSPLIGTLVSMDGRDSVDVLCRCGFDWLFLDLEHSSLSIGDAKAMLQVVGDRIPVLARVAANTPTDIHAALDIGCDGVIVPLVNSNADAKAAVKASKYPPDGARSVGIGRAHGYGSKFNEYLARANRETALIVQIEHREAVDNLGEILCVKGIDAVFIGPYDLSGSMGLLGQVTHEAVRAAIRQIRSQCDALGMPHGSFGMTASACEEAVRHGAKFVVVGTDAMHLYNGAKAQLNVLRGDR